MKSNNSKDKYKSKSSKSKTKRNISSNESFLSKYLINKRKSNLIKTPIDDSKLSIREMKHSDKYDLYKIVSDFRHAYYINVYKTVFRSWFTYALTICLLALSLSFINSRSSAFFLPPIIMSICLIYRVNRYKRLNRNLNVNDMETLNQNDSFLCKYKSTEQRRMNQGVLLIFVKEDKFDEMEDFDLDNLNESDLNTTSSEDEDGLDSDKHKKLIGYLIYSRQKDELETVAIKEICIHSDYRERRVAANFLRRVCINIFRSYDFRRVTFQVSNLDLDMKEILENRTHFFNKIYSWTAYNFVPGVVDERTVYSFDINKIKNEKY